MVYKSIDQKENYGRFVLQQQGKSTSGIGFIFRWESARVTSDVFVIVCTLLDNSYEPISVREFWHFFVKREIELLPSLLWG